MFYALIDKRIRKSFIKMIHLNQKEFGIYISRKLVNIDQWVNWCKDQGYTDVNLDPHITIAYSRKFFFNKKSKFKNVIIRPDKFISIMTLGDGTVLSFTSNILTSSWKRKKEMGAIWDYPDFIPHITLAYTHQEFKGELPPFPLIFGAEEESMLSETYVEDAETT